VVKNDAHFASIGELDRVAGEVLGFGFFGFFQFVLVFLFGFFLDKPSSLYMLVHILTQQPPPLTREVRGMLQPKSSWRPFWMWPATFAAVVFVLWVLVAIPALGQNRNAGEIRGTVVDATGAAVPGVSVVVTNVATGIATTTATLDAGVYDLPRVDTGRYTVTFTKEGFKRVVRNDVEVHVEAITVDATLEVGSVATQVTVTAKNELLQTENSERTVVLSPTQITELPNVGHNWWSYTLLIPGANPGKGSPGSFSNGNNVGINGSQSNMSSWLIDGGTFTYPGSYNGATQMPLEAIGEINITASDAGAEYGNGMSIMQVITKGGTNSFHGAAFEFVQNDVFNARNFFAPKTSPERWNEFGGTIGGPIRKDKAFFFFGYQRNPIVAHSPTFYTFPTDAMRAGDFSAAGFPTIYDPSTTVLVNGQYVRQPFPGNSIPQSSFDSVAAATLQYYPKPNLPGLFNNYYADLPSPDTSTWYNFRVDGNISDKHRIMVSGLINKEFIFQNTPNCPVNCLDIWGGPNLTGQITETYSISSTLVNEFRLADNHGRVHNWGPDYKAGFPQKLGLKNAVVDAFPNINIGGVVSPSGLGTAPSNALYQNNFVAADTLNWIKGKHAIKLGGEFDKWNVNQAPFLFVQSGTFTFSGIFTRNPSDPSSVGLGYADFLLGLPQTWSVQTGPLTGGRVHNVQLFAQDSYKVRPNLTLNYGIRYLYQAGWTEEHNHIAQFDPTILNPVTNTLGAVWFGGANGRTAVQKSHPAVFLPRVGLSWSPKTSWTVRGAYGIYPMPGVIKITLGQARVKPAGSSKDLRRPRISLIRSFSYHKGHQRQFIRQPIQSQPLQPC